MRCVFRWAPSLYLRMRIFISICFFVRLYLLVVQNTPSRLPMLSGIGLRFGRLCVACLTLAPPHPWFEYVSVFVGVWMYCGYATVLIFLPSPPAPLKPVRPNNLELQVWVVSEEAFKRCIGIRGVDLCFYVVLQMEVFKACGGCLHW